MIMNTTTTTCTPTPAYDSILGRYNSTGLPSNATFGYDPPAGIVPGTGTKDSILNCIRHNLATGEEAEKVVKRAEACESNHVYPTPKPVRIDTYNNRVVKVTFEDGSFTRSVCSYADTFNLDVGITICILKKVMAKENSDGHKAYNNMMRSIHRIMDENEKAKEEERKEKSKRKEKQRKSELKNAAKKLKDRQEQIDIQKVAFAEALRERDKREEGRT